MKNEILTKLHLNFLNPKLQGEYDLKNKKENYAYLRKISIISCVFSIFLVIICSFIFLDGNSGLTNKNLILLEKNKIYVNFKILNYTQCDLILEDYLDFTSYYGQYYLINEKYQNFIEAFFISFNFSDFSNENLLSYNLGKFINSTLFYEKSKDTLDEFIQDNIFNNQNYHENKNLIRKNFFGKGCIYSAIFAFIIYVVLIVINFKSDTTKYSIFNFGIFYIFFGLNFHILAGILRSYLNFNSETLFILIGVKLICNVFSSIKFKINWIYFLFIIFIKNTFEISFIFLIHINLNSTLVNYLLVNSIFDLASILVCYNNEIFLKTIFFYMWKIENEKKYLDNLIDNMGQGFISISLNDFNIKKQNKAIKILFEQIKNEFVFNFSNKIEKKNLFYK